MVEVLAVVGVLAAIWVAFHLRPLDEGEIEALANKRRERKAREEYSFAEAIVPEGKVSLPARGAMLDMDITVRLFPAWVACQLKGKKHEWLAVGFARGGIVERAWFNKGPNNVEVSLELEFSEIERVIRRHKVEALLVLHNHPNPDPGRYRCDQASEQDMVFARAMHREFGQWHIIKFVCERGNHHEYWRSVGTEAMPLKPFIEKAESDNQGSPLRRLGLHIERIF